jgi:hypothetical protein
VKAVLAAFVLLLAVGATARAAERLDDSASPRSRVPARVVLTNEGRTMMASRNPSRAVVQLGRVDFRLATTRHIGKQARIYFVVPPFVTGLRSPAGMRVDWRGNGNFANGSAHPGERQLVWSGIVTGPWMNEGIELSFEVELRELQLQADGQFGFEPFFEIEVSP